MYIKTGLNNYIIYKKITSRLLQIDSKLLHAAGFNEIVREARKDNIPLQFRLDFMPSTFAEMSISRMKTTMVVLREFGHHDMRDSTILIMLKANL
jgi:hypothetical protein